MQLGQREGSGNYISCGGEAHESPKDSHKGALEPKGVADSGHSVSQHLLVPLFPRDVTS